MFGWLFGSNNSNENKDETKKEDQGVFGIDWDGDGEVTEFDDLMTMDILSDD